MIKRKLERIGLNEVEIQEMREAFNLFDTENTGKILPSVIIFIQELKAAMRSLNFESKNPTIFNMILEIDFVDREIDFNEFISAISQKLGDKESRESLDKIFDIFDEDNTGKINLNNLKKIAKELGESMSNEELSEMLERASTSGKEISKEDFYNIMTKQTF